MISRQRGCTNASSIAANEQEKNRCRAAEQPQCKQRVHGYNGNRSDFISIEANRRKEIDGQARQPKTITKALAAERGPTRQLVFHQLARDQHSAQAKKTLANDKFQFIAHEQLQWHKNERLESNGITGRVMHSSLCGFDQFGRSVIEPE